MRELKERYSIVIVNMQQAARVSGMGDTTRVFTNPSDPRTEAYISGKVG